MRIALVSTALLASVFLQSRAPAQSAPAAQLLFDEGRAAMADGDYAIACAKLADSQKLAPAPGTLFNLALCYEKAGRTASAWVTYRDAAVAYERVDRTEWAVRARDKWRELEPMLARVTIELAKPVAVGTVVRRDGGEVVPSELSLAVPVDPGDHVIDAAAPGHESFNRRIVVEKGVSVTVTVPALAPKVAASPPPVDPSPTPAVAPAPSPEASHRGARFSGQQTIGLVGAGVGIVGLGVGSVLGLMAMSEHDDARRDCPAKGACSSRAGVDANESARSLATGSTVAFVVGGVLVAAGATIFLTAPKSPAAAAVRLGPNHVAVVARW